MNYSNITLFKVCIVAGERLFGFGGVESLQSSSVYGFIHKSPIATSVRNYLELRFRPTELDDTATKGEYLESYSSASLVNQKPG